MAFLYTLIIFNKAKALGEDALRAFSIRTVVATKDTEANKKIFNEIVEEHSSHFLSTKYIF